jgi:hypothetical protein
MPAGAAPSASLRSFLWPSGEGHGRLWRAGYQGCGSASHGEEAGHTGESSALPPHRPSLLAMEAGVLNAPSFPLQEHSKAVDWLGKMEQKVAARVLDLLAATNPELVLSLREHLKGTQLAEESSKGGQESARPGRRRAQQPRYAVWGTARSVTLFCRASSLCASQCEMPAPCAHVNLALVNAGLKCPRWSRLSLIMRSTQSLQARSGAATRLRRTLTPLAVTMRQRRGRPGCVASLASSSDHVVESGSRI